MCNKQKINSSEHISANYHISRIKDNQLPSFMPLPHFVEDQFAYTTSVFSVFLSSRLWPLRTVEE